MAKTVTSVQKIEIVCKPGTLNIWGISAIVTCDDGAGYKKLIRKNIQISTLGSSTKTTLLGLWEALKDQIESENSLTATSDSGIDTSTFPPEFPL